MALICWKCGAVLRHTRYPDFVPDCYLFDENGLAGCPEGNLHEASSGGRPAIHVPYVDTLLHPGTVEAVHASGSPHLFHNLDPSDPGAYGRLFRRLWATGDTFIICEHDVIPTVAQLDNITSCGHDWCSYRYDSDLYPGGPMFGLCRFGRRLMADHPLAAEVATMADREHGIERGWWDLDSYVARDLTIRGATWTEHLPPVRHAHHGPATQPPRMAEHRVRGQAGAGPVG